MHHRKTKIAAPTAAATTITPQQEEKEEGQSSHSSSSSYSPRRLKLYTPEEIKHCENSKTILKYIEAKTIQDKNTGITYKTQMQSFAQFVYRRYNKTQVDNFLEQIKAGKYDPYDILTEYAGFLRNERPPNESKLTANVIRFRVKTARKFFRFNKILVTTEDFNELVPLPRKEQPPKKGIDKTTVATYLNACKNIQLKTALHVMASNGPRPIELCAVRECDVDLDSDPATITYRAEYSKMRVARTRPLTREAANQLRLWDKFKYRTRWTTVKEEETGESVRKFAAPKRNPHNLLLSMPHLNGEKSTPEGLYDYFAEAFAELVDTLDNGGGSSGDGGSSNNNSSRKIGEHRKVTLKTFRDFVKSTISDLGYTDFSEWMIGHAGSTYYQKSEKERMDLFRKLEPYLTYLDVASLEARGADVEAKTQQVMAENLSLKQQVDELYRVLYAQGIIKKEPSSVSPFSSY
jgi:integrase